MDQPNFKEQAARRIAELKTIRDEIRLDLHLATMDLKDEWHTIERKLPDPGGALEDMKDSTLERFELLRAELHAFRDRLRKAV